MIKANLTELYKSLNENVEKVFVVPKINFENKDTDYLYRLYKDFIEISEEKIEIESLSVFAHPIFFFKQLTNRKIVLHYHWFEVQDFKSLTGMVWKILWLTFYKIIGGKLVWTVHNKYPHTNKFRRLNCFIRRKMAKAANIMHVHCTDAVNVMSEILSVTKKKFFILNHPDFNANVFQQAKAKELFAAKYNITFSDRDKLFLMFGNIASYKGILESAECFTRLSENNKLLIAGGIKKGNEKYFSELKEIAERTNNIIIIDKIIPEKEVPVFFNLTDYVLFNYNNILTSGGIFLALNYHKKIIAPSIGCIPEINSPNIIPFEKSDQVNDYLHETLSKLGNDVK